MKIHSIQISKLWIFVFGLLFVYIYTSPSLESRPGGGSSFKSAGTASSVSNSSKSSSSSGSSYSASTTSTSSSNSSTSSSSYKSTSKSSSSSSSNSDDFIGLLVVFLIEILIELVSALIDNLTLEQKKIAGMGICFIIGFVLEYYAILTIGRNSKDRAISFFIFIALALSVGFLIPFLLGYKEFSLVFAFITLLAILYFVINWIRCVKEENQHLERRRVAALPEIDHVITEYKKIDPNFSRILFLDYAASLFHHFHHKEENITNEYSGLINRDYLSYIMNLFGVDAKEIVIGSMKFERFYQKGEKDVLVVTFDANYTQFDTHTSENLRKIVQEVWEFERKSGVLSLPPEKMQKVCCPSCGAPAKFTNVGACTYCETHIQPASLQWFVRSVFLRKREIFSTDGLAHYEEEVGTDLPTLISSSLSIEKEIFLQRHTQITDFELFFSQFKNEVVIAYFKEIYKAWERLKWENARHLVTDRLYTSNKFWIDIYKDQKLKPVLKDIEVSNVELSRIESDAYFDSITVRIFASCFDFVENEEGNVIGGNSKERRVYSEYWTFIRTASSGDKNFTSVSSLQQCPSCGNPIDKISDAAECGYCNSKVSTGEFGWILAMITQDEVYAL